MNGSTVWRKPPPGTTTHTPISPHSPLLATADHIFTCSKRQRTRTVGITSLLFGCSASYWVQCLLLGAVPLIGCSAPYRVQCPRACGGCRGCGGLLSLSCLLGLSSVWSTSWCLCGASCCGSSEMSHAIPRHVFQTLKSHCWNSAVFSIPMKS